MKQKIKIMKHKPELSDEEVQRYMNFDRLLEDKKLIENHARFTFLKKLIPILIIIGGTAWLTFLSLDESPSESPVSEPPKVQQLPTQPEKQAPPKTEKAHSGYVESDQAQSNSASALEKAEVKRPERSTVEKQVEGDVYIQAEPVDGYSTLYTYFNSHLVYPTESVKDSIQGVQTISFVINAQGMPEKIEMKQSLGEPFDREARRLIENMPLWKPASLNGIPVSSQMSLPLTFQVHKVNVNK